MLMSIIIPSFNEEKRLESTLKRVEEYLSSKTYEHEIIIVDDGSSDGTFQLAQEFKARCKDEVSIVKNDINMGKGYSTKRGILASKGDFVLFTDADLSTPIEEVDKLLPQMDEGNDVVIGSRAGKESDVRVHQPWYRQTMGKVFNLFVRILLFKDFRDTQCGFKLFKGDIVREIATELKINGFCFDVELIYLILRKGYKIKEIGIVWDNSPDSRVKIINSSVGMFIDLFRIKSIHRDKN